MDKQTFLSSDPLTLPPALRALWHGDWQAAHEDAQAGEDKDSAWVHAYLHRKEGDQWNAEYWYRRAGQPVFRGGLTEEWAAMVAALLSKNDR